MSNRAGERVDTGTPVCQNGPSGGCIIAKTIIGPATADPYRKPIRCGRCCLATSCDLASLLGFDLAQPLQH